MAIYCVPSLKPLEIRHPREFRESMSEHTWSPARQLPRVSQLKK
jgi:hypothetical protein